MNNSQKQKPSRFWRRESIQDEEKTILHQIMGVRTCEAVEASISFAHFLRLSGLNSENYPLFLKMLEIENHWVVDALIGGGDPFLFFSSIPPNRYMLMKAFDLLTRWKPGEIYSKTKAIILGILQNAYSSPQDGYKINPVDISAINNLGKHLEQEKGQDDPQNRCILDILEKISQLEGLHWDETMEGVARQALKIRSTFFDNTKMLEDAIPQVLIVRGSYRDNEIEPRRGFIS